MKTIKLFICGAMLLLAGSLSLKAQTNLIANGGFETLDKNGLPLGWSVASEDTLKAEADDKEVGNYAAKISSLWSQSIGPRFDLNSDYSIDSIRVGETYVLSFKYKSLEQTTEQEWLNDANYNFLQVMCALKPAISSSLYPAGIKNTTLDEIYGEWLSYEVEFTVPDKKPAYVFRFGISAGNRVFYIDDVKLVKKVTETPTNLISNGNFETVGANGKLTGWGDEFNDDFTALTADYTSVNTTDFKEGEKSGSFERNPIHSYTSAKNWIKNIPANKTYNFSFWYKVDKLDENGMEPSLSMEGTAFYSTGSISSENFALLGEPLNLIAGEWLFGEVKGVKSLAEVDDLIIGFVGYNCNFLLDDVKMVDADLTGINNVKADTKLPIYASDGILYIGGTTQGETILVYTITGQIQKSEQAQNGTTKITDLPTGQIYIVRCGDKSAKVAL